MLGNVIPEFDPMNKSQTIQNWLSKVEECARMYKWDSDQIVHYAMPKLVGVAKTWYQSLPTMSFSWSEWKDKLSESFPSSDDYAELISEMLARRARFGESLELYFYEKINLLNRLEIGGKRAVDCLLHGVDDRSVRLGAKAANCMEPEQVLKYFQSIKQRSRESEKIKNVHSKRFDSVIETSGTNTASNGSKSAKPAPSTITCYNCNEQGHYSFKCTKKIMKCTVCNRLGHLAINCSRLPSDDKSGDSKEKTVMLVKLEDVNDNKYVMNLKVNDRSVIGYIDLGSQCTLLRHSRAVSMGITWSVDNLPVMRGIGDNIVVPIGAATATIEICGIVESVDIYIVDDNAIKYDVLIGHSFTEKPGIVITKTTDSLTFERNPPIRCTLRLRDDIVMQPGVLTAVPIYSDVEYSGHVYVRGLLRGEPGSEYYLMPGEYEIHNGTSGLLIQNVSKGALKLKKSLLITRALPIREYKDVRILEQKDLESDSILNYGDQLTEKEIIELQAMLMKYKTCFSRNLKDLGFTNAVQMEIKLTDAKPVVYRPYRLSVSERKMVREMVQEMIDADIVTESNSSYASPILIVKKKTGEQRLCVDYRSLNRKTIKEHYPLPLIDDQLDMLAGNSLFITLDLASGYYQIPVALESQDKTAFVTPDGQYQFKRMPFGLANAPSVFQRTMNKILARVKNNFALIYMDDILIPAHSFEEGLERLEEVLKIISETGLTLKLSKCNFFREEIDFLGFEITGSGIRPGTRKITAVSNFPVPRNVHEVRQFIGLASFFRRFVKNFAIIARPLTDLLKTRFGWKWTDEQANAFHVLKEKLVERPIMALYDVKLETELHTDASRFGVAGILMQRDTEGTIRPVAYYSRKTTDDEQKLHSFDLETLAVIASLQRFRVYLLGIRFKIITDCNALRTTLTKRDLIPRVARWWIQLQEYDCEIEYRPGPRMAHVDALSRNPTIESRLSEERCILDVLQVEMKDWIATVQGADDEIKRIKEILENRETEYIADIHKNYKLKGGYVYKLIDGKTKWLVPKGVRWQILRMNHDNSGHFGFEKTLSRIQESFWFPKMRRFTKKYVSACLECAHHKAPGGPKEGLLHTIPKIEVPFHTLHADHLGPFIRSKRGNAYLLTIIDAFTRYICIKAVRDTKTATAIRIFKEHFGYFGTPNRLITDRGTCFTSSKFKFFTQSLGIKHTLNAVATPRANGQIERFNRTIVDALGARCHGEKENTWDDYIGEIQLGINTTVNKSTGKSPSDLLFGCKLVNPSENIINDVIYSTNSRVSDDSLSNMRSEASERVRKQQEAAKKNFDKRRKLPTSYKIGDLVRIERTLTDKAMLGKPKKLTAKFQGPYRIIKILPNDRFLVEDTPITRKGNRRYENIVAIDKLHPWLNFNSLTSDDSDSDQKDEETTETNQNNVSADCIE